MSADGSGPAVSQVSEVARLLLSRLDEPARLRVASVTGVPVAAWLTAGWEVVPGGLRGTHPGAATLLSMPGEVLDDNPPVFTCAAFGPGGQVTVIVHGARCDVQDSLPW